MLVCRCYSSHVIAAIVFVAMLGLLCLFQLGLALGLPWGRAAWGGQHEGVLPRKLRIASVLSIVIYAFIALIALERVGLTEFFAKSFAHVAMWVIFGYLCLGVLMNGISRSKIERAIMTPVALVLAVLALCIALGV